MRRLRLPALPVLLASAALAAGCDLGVGKEGMNVTSQRFVYDVHASGLKADERVVLSSPAVHTVSAMLPGELSASDLAGATLVGVQVEQLAPSGAVYDLGRVRDLSLRLNGQAVAANATPSGTTASLAPLPGSLRAVFAPGSVSAQLSFTPTHALGEGYALRVTFVVRAAMRDF